MDNTGKGIRKQFKVSFVCYSNGKTVIDLKHENSWLFFSIL